MTRQRDHPAPSGEATGVTYLGITPRIYSTTRVPRHQLT